MSSKVCISETTNPSSLIEAFTSEVFVTPDIAIRCVICDEHTPMYSYNGRAHEVFICDKCKAAIKHVRNYLETGELD